MLEIAKEIGRCISWREEKRETWWRWYFMSRHLIIFLQRGWSQEGQRHDLCEGVVASIIRGAALDRPTPPRPTRQPRRMHLTWPQHFSSGLSWTHPVLPSQARMRLPWPSLWPPWAIPWAQTLKDFMDLYIYLGQEFSSYWLRTTKLTISKNAN